MVATMARLHHALLLGLFIVLCLTLYCHARDTPSTFKKMLMAAGAENALKQERIDSGQHALRRRNAPKPAFRTQLKSLGKSVDKHNEGHVIDKRSHGGPHGGLVDELQLLLEDAPRMMEKRAYIPKAKHRKYKLQSYSISRKTYKPKSKPSINSGSAASSLLSDITKKLTKEQVSQDKEEEEQKEKQEDTVNQILALLGIAPASDDEDELNLKSKSVMTIRRGTMNTILGLLKKTLQ
ncbi:uncharacterized protein [Amphiura filiformis]|uniref:uncharacterized protein n=1 Tax=Amphiura filiformis TaxID=82378 RepID=UPI003B20DAE3